MKLRFGLQVCQFWVAARAKAATAFEKHSNCLSTSIDLVRRSEGGFDLCQPHVESRYLGLRILIKPHSIKPHSALFLLDYRLPYHLPCLHLHHFRGQRTSVLVFRAPASLEDEGGSASAFLLAFARPPFQSHSEIIFMWELLCEIRGVSCTLHSCRTRNLWSNKWTPSPRPEAQWGGGVGVERPL
jgi:hypothetical protein